MEAAAFITSAGLQMAVIPKQCSYSEPLETCSEAIEKIITALAHAAELTAQCATDNGCVQGGITAFKDITVLYDMATSLRPLSDWGKTNPGKCYRPPALAIQLLGDQMTKVATSITDTTVTCTGDDSVGPSGLTKTQMGHCVGKIMGTGVILSAAGMGIGEAKETCDGAMGSNKCHLSRLYVFNTMSLGADSAIGAAKDCGAEGNMDCASDIADISAGITAAGTWSVTLKDSVEANGAPTVSTDIDLGTLGATVEGLMSTVEDTVQTCGKKAGPKIKYGACVGDGIAGIAYLAAASEAISIAVKDCASKCDHPYEEVLTCIGDLSFIMGTYAAAVDEILWATSDCAKEELLDTQCASDITTSVSAIAGATGASAALAKMAIEDDLMKLATTRDAVTGLTAVETVGASLNSLSKKIGDVVGSCKSERRLNARGHTKAQKYAQKWNWGAKAKAWLDGTAVKEAQSKSHALNMGTVAAVAGVSALGFVFLTMVTVSVRLLSRRANAKVTVQGVSAQEDAELLEEIGQ